MPEYRSKEAWGPLATLRPDEFEQVIHGPFGSLDRALEKQLQEMAAEQERLEKMYMDEAFDKWWKGDM